MDHKEHSITYQSNYRYQYSKWNGYGYIDDYDDVTYYGMCIVDRTIITTRDYSCFNVKIWKNILDINNSDIYEKEPEVGKVYLEEDCDGMKINPVEYIEFDFTKSEHSDADFEIFQPHLEYLYICFDIQKTIKFIRDDIHKVTTNIKLSKKAKKSRNSSNDTKIYEMINENIPSYSKMLYDSITQAETIEKYGKQTLKIKQIISKTFTNVVIQLEVIPMLPSVETKENPHVSKKKRKTK